MGAITFDFADKVEGEPCQCCGGKTTRLTRFVYSNGDAYAVYYAAFSNKHPDRYASVLVSLGGWGEGTTPEDRVAFALRIRSAKSEYQVMIVDAVQSPWHDVTFLGRVLDRKEAKQHARINEVFHITDQIGIEDKELRDYLNRNDAAQ
jgi:hypothetical protein